MIYLELFWSFFQIGLFSVGGGYAAMPLIQEQVVTQHQWLQYSEFIDLITISQMTPGPIAINSATFVGIRIAGFGGALVATLGCIFPSCVIVYLLAKLYLKYRNLSLLQGVLSGLRPTVVALIASAGITILITSLWGEGGFVPDFQAVDYVAMGIFGACLFALRKWKLNPVYVMLGAGAAGGLLYFWL